MKIKIFDCSDFNHNLTMIIPDLGYNPRENVYCVLEKHDGLSPRQIAKLEAFKQSCRGLYMVPWQICGSIHQPIFRKEFFFNAIEVYQAGNYVHILCRTSVQGQREYAYRVRASVYNYERAVAEILKAQEVGDSDYVTEVWCGRNVR